MPRTVRCALIQASNTVSTDRSLDQIRKAMIDKHLKLIEQAARKKGTASLPAGIVLRAIFLCEQNARWYEITEGVPDGPTTRLMQKVAAKHRMAIVVPVYEEHMPGVYFNTAAVIDADGRYLGKYRKHHIPHCQTICRSFLPIIVRSALRSKKNWAVRILRKSRMEVRALSIA